MDSKRLAFGAATMAVCNVGKIALQLLLTPTLARLLGPSEFGLYSLAMPSVMFLMMLADAGIGQSLARESEDHHIVWSSAFWLLLGLGCTLAAGLSLWSFPLSLIAHQPRLPSIMLPLSLSIVMMVLALPPSARLTRRNRIEIYAIVDLCANLVGACVAIGLALNHLGVWSLVGQLLTLYTSRAIALNLSAPLLPSFKFSWKAVVPHTAMGGGIVATKFVDSFARMLEASIVSRRFGVASLGLYSFSYQAAWSIGQAANNPIWTVLYVHTLKQNDEAGRRQLYIRLIRLAAILTLPVTALIGVLASRLTHDLLGPAWGKGSLILAITFPTLAIGLLGQLSGAVLYGQGRSAPQTYVAGIYAALRLVAVLSPLGGWTGVALCAGFANLTYFVVGIANAKINLGWPIWPTFRALRGPVLAAAAASGAIWLLRNSGPHGIIGLALLLIAGGVLYLLALVAFDFREIKDDVTNGLAMLKSRSNRAEAVVAAQ